MDPSPESAALPPRISASGAPGVRGSATGQVPRDLRAATPSPNPLNGHVEIRGAVSEIFSSLQGEGLYLGERHVFLRLAGCPWRCRYCDTADSLTDEGAPRLTVQETLKKVGECLGQRPHKAASLTGGEPLAQTDFLEALLPGLKALGLRTYLETSATQPHLFRRVAGDIDVVAADIKLPSAIGRSFWAEHEEFLRLAGEKAFAKLVLTAQTTDEEMEETVNLLQRLTPTPPLVLQPVTPILDLECRLQDAPSASPAQIAPPPPARIAAWWDWARQKLPVVKLIPQMHPVWGLP